MCVLLFEVFKYLLLIKKGILKTSEKSKFLRKEIWGITLALKSKKVQGTFGKFKLFCSRDKRLLSEFLKKWGWFQGHN